MSSSAAPDPFHLTVTRQRTSVYTPRTFKWDYAVLLDMYEFGNPNPSGYTFHFSSKICNYIQLEDGEISYKDGSKVQLT